MTQVINRAGKVMIVGATGETGLRLGRLLAQRGTPVCGLHRRPEQADTLKSLGVEPVLADLEHDSTGRIAELLAGVQNIVYTAGSSATASDAECDAIDGCGVIKMASAALDAGVHRFLLVSAFPDAGRGGDPSPPFEHYMAVKREADVYLAATPLNWVIVRPGTLTSLPGTGQVSTGLAIPYAEVSRDDVAAVLAELVHLPHVNRLIFELTNGTVPVHEAVTAMALFSGQAIYRHDRH